MSTRLERAARLLTALGLVGVAGVAVPPSAAAAPPAENTYTLSAEADGLSVVVSGDGLPLVQTIALAPYGAAASGSSVGESMASAGIPYSPLAASLPGTVNGLGAGGLLPPLPPLPGYVSSSYPSREKDKQTQGPYAISATSQQYRSRGEAALGPQNPGGTSAFFASAEVHADDDGTVTATGTAGADLLSFGDLLDIGNVSSTTTMTQEPSGAPKITSETKLGTITLLGKLSGLTGTGLSLLGMNLKVPLTTTLIPVLNNVLKPFGLGLQYLPVKYTYTDGTTSTGAPEPSKKVQGIDSGGLQVTFAQDTKAAGVVTTTLVLGRVFLSSNNEKGVPFTPPPVSEPAGGAVGGVSAPPPVQGPAPAAPVDTGGEPVAAGQDVPAPPTPQAPTAAPPVDAPVASGQILVADVRTTAAQGLFLVLALGALAVFGASQLIRLFGVRMQL